jgi:hypothetical protein
MDAALAFLSKLLGTTARIGAIIALTALTLIVLVQAQIQPFAQIAGTTLYQTIIVAGIVGASTVVVEIFIALRRLLKERAQRKLVFIEQPGGFWDYVEKDGVLQLHAVLHVANNNCDGVIISRPQLCLPAFARKRIWQQCFQFYVGDDLFAPGMVVGAGFPPKTLSVMVVKHIHRVNQPRSRAIVFLFDFRDQWKRRHCTRLHLERRQPINAG